jgi:hypothetical protein
MIRRLSSWSTAAVNNGVLITLTYPGTFTHDARQWKGHLDAWWKRFQRRWAGATMLWKKEFQERGAPHFHCLVVGVAFVPMAWIARSWFEVVASEDPAHLVAGTEVHRVRSKRQALAYISKYLGKVDQTDHDDHPGRFWGILGRSHEPRSLEEARISPQAKVMLVRQIRRIFEHRPSRRRRSWCGAHWIIMPGLPALRLAEWACTIG